jgi:hypothetical protein
MKPISLAAMRRAVQTPVKPRTETKAQLSARNAELVRQIGIVMEQRDELATVLGSMMEFWDNKSPVHSGAFLVDDARAALAKLKGRP